MICLLYDGAMPNEPGIVYHSIALYYISLLSGLGNQIRNSNINNRDHQVGDNLLTMVMI